MPDENFQMMMTAFPALIAFVGIIIVAMIIVMVVRIVRGGPASSAREPLESQLNDILLQQQIQQQLNEQNIQQNIAQQQIDNQNNGSI